jgi:hypothetical protein
MMPYQRLTLAWLRSVVYAYDRDPQIHDFRKEEPDFNWVRQGETTGLELHHLPEPKRPERWSLPLLSLVAFGGAGLWFAMARWRHQSLSHGVPGMLILLVIGGLCWPIARITVRSPFVAVPNFSDDEAKALTSSLLRNIYQAFEYRTESDVYDALAQSVDGKLLETLYLQLQQGLKMQEQGGAVARVQGCADILSSLLSEPGILKCVILNVGNMQDL